MPRPSKYIPFMPEVDPWNYKASDWLGWILKETEGSPPGNGPAANGHAEIAFPGEALNADEYIPGTNSLKRDVCVIYARLDGATATEYDGAIAYRIPSKLYAGKSTVKFRIEFGKYSMSTTCNLFDVDVYFQRIGTSPNKVASDTVIPAPGQLRRRTIEVDLSASISADDLYELWIGVDIHRPVDMSSTKYPIAVILSPVDLTISHDDTIDSTRNFTINMGSPATAWGSLSELSLENQTLISFNQDYRSATSFVFEADASAHLDLSTYNHKRVQFEVGGDVKLRGRVQKIVGVGESLERYQFTCVDFRGCARNVPCVKNTAFLPSPPLRIYNAEEDDPEYQDCSGTGMTVGEIIEDLLDGHDDELYAEDAVYNKSAMYESSETALLDYIPGKIYLKDKNMEQAVSAVLSEMGRSWALFVDPVDGKWHFYNIRDGGTSTDIIVDESAGIRDRLSQSVEDCYTALTLFGKEAAGYDIKKEKIGVTGSQDGSGTALMGLAAKWDTALEPENAGDWDLKKGLGEKGYGVVFNMNKGSTSSTVTDIYKSFEDDFWVDGYIVFPTVSSTRYLITANTATVITFDHPAGQNPLDDVSTYDQFFLILENDYTWVFRRFKISDYAKRNLIEGGEFSGMDCCPKLWVYGFVGDDPAQGLITKFAIPIKIIKDVDGETDEPYILTQYPLIKTDSTWGYILAPNFGFEYCFKGSTEGFHLSARYPSSGYEGDAYDTFGIEREKTLIISEFNTLDNQADFESLAEELLKPYMDPQISGTIDRDDVLWTYEGLYRQVNLFTEAKSAPYHSGIPLLGIKIDFLAEKTTLHLSNNFRDGFGYDKLLERFVKDLKTDADYYAGVDHDHYIVCSKGQDMAETVDSKDDRLFDSPLESIPAPTWGSFHSGPAGTRCDEKTYTKQGGMGAVYAQMLLCGQGIAGQSYFQTTGTKTPMHGIVLRAGAGAGGSSVANTHMLYPYICIAGNPSSSIGTCGGSGNMKKLDLIVPTSPASTSMTMEDFVPVFLKAYANFVQFTSQGFMCTDDRFFRLDQGLWGIHIGDIKPDNVLIDMICAAIGKCAGGLAEQISKVDAHFAFWAAKMGANCSGGHAYGPPCSIDVSAGSAIGPYTVTATIDYKDHPVCSVGQVTENCCAKVR